MKWHEVECNEAKTLLIYCKLADLLFVNANLVVKSRKCVKKLGGSSILKVKLFMKSENKT